MEIWNGQAWTGVSAPKWRALLALLLLRAGQPVATDELIDGLWGDTPPAKASNLVSVYVLRLRRLIGDDDGSVLVTRAPGYQVAAAPGDLDVDRFNRLATDGRRALAAGDPVAAQALLTEALGLWRGRALTDVPSSPLVAAEADRLEESRVSALELRVEADLAFGQASSVVPELRRALADHPLREGLWALLMRALHGAGRQAEALEAYAKARELIADELGVDPGAELRQIYTDILRGDAGSRTAGVTGRTAGASVRAAGSGRPVESGWAAGGERGADSAGGERAAEAAGRTAGAGRPVESGRPGGSGHPGGSERAAAGEETARGGRAAQDAAAPGPPGRPAGSGPDAADPVASARPVPGAGAPAAGPRTSPGASPAHDGRPAASAAARAANPVFAPPPAFVPPAQLPADIPDFTGRADQMVEIRRLLPGEPQADSPGAVPVVLLMGSGGLGKTTLAVHAAHLLAAQYPDGQLHASLLGATQPADPAEVLARFLRDLGVEPARIPVSEEERAAHYRTRLAGRRVLVLLDDARDAAQVRPILPGSASCAVLITSRNRLPELAGTRVIDLEVLTAEEARSLFGRIAGEERAQAEPEATEEVLTACAGLPLAIRIAGARLAARGGWNVHYLADRLSDERRRLDELRTGNLAVRASFEVSFASLAARPGGVDPTRSFRLLGVWTGPSISLPAAAALLGEPEDDVADALEILVDAHLLDSPAPDRYRFHDLLRVFAADRARAQESEQDRQEAITRLLLWYLYTTEAGAEVIFPQNSRVPLEPPPLAVRPLSFATLDEALDWCEAERAGLAAATRLAASEGLHEIAWKLPAAALSFFMRRSHWADWVAADQIGLASARLLGDRGAEARMLNNLGIAYGQQRMEEAIDCFEESLSIYRLLSDIRGESRVATNLANAYHDVRRFEDARRAAEESLTIQRMAGKRYGEGIALGVLGSAYRELGRHGEAVQHLQQALAIFRELGDRGTEADSLSDLGGAYLALGKIDEATACLTESLAIRRDISDRHGQAITLQSLALARQRVGDLDEMAALLYEALQLFEELGDHARAANVRVSLAEGTRAAG